MSDKYELNDLVYQLKSRLIPEVFNQIKYLVKKDLMIIL